jgi:hypothetical protein
MSLGLFTSLVSKFAIADAFKTAWMTIVVLAVDVSFVKSLVLVIASAIGTGVFTVITALIQARSNEQTHRRLTRLERRQRDVAAKLGLKERHTETSEDERS